MYWTLNTNVCDFPEIVQISYDEPNAKANWAHIAHQFPRAKSVHGVTGIHNAYKRAAELCTSTWLLTIDGDNRINPDLKTIIGPVSTLSEGVYVWRAKNPVNDLAYGFGGVKLWPRKLLLGAVMNGTDFTTSIASRTFAGYVPVNRVAGTTLFNSSPLTAWRGAFRECAKLASNSIQNADSRSSEWLRIWTTRRKVSHYDEYVFLGAIQGRQYGLQHCANPTALRKLNDYSWLRDVFESECSQRASTLCRAK